MRQTSTSLEKSQTETLGSLPLILIGDPVFSIFSPN
jgi:hypothetical protein